MKIEIRASSSCYDPKVYADGKLTASPAKNICDPFGWSDEELEALLGLKNYEALKEGRKFAFNVSDSHFKLITGQRAAKNTFELKLLTQYNLI